MKISAFALLSLGLCLFACSKNNESGSLKINAQANDTTGTSVGRLVDGERVSAYLKSNSAYYRLECSSMLGLEQLIKGTGYPLDKISKSPSYRYNDLAMMPGARLDFPLSCDLGKDSRARLVRLVDSDKYFISFNDGSQSKFTLRMLGCSSLIAALGFDQTKALPVTADSFEIFDAVDSLDISCYAGEKPSVDQPVTPYVLAADNAELLRVRDFETNLIDFALFNGSRAFQFECSTDSSGSRRMQAFGFNPEMAHLTPVLTFDSEKALGSELATQPVLKCDDSSAQLKYIDWPAGRKHYLFLNNKVNDRAVLHEVSCRELVEYINPELLKSPTAIDPETAAFFYDYAAENKLACLRGNAI